MANTGDNNVCKDLHVEEQISKDFDKIFNMQKSLQDKIGCDFSKMSIDEIAKFNFANKHAFDDEFCEMMDALGGIKDGIGNAAWKWWKVDNAKASSMKPKDLSDGDILELKFEVVDMFHFMINKALSIGMTGSEVFSMYISKNKENFERQESGY